MEKNPLLLEDETNYVGPLMMIVGVLATGFVLFSVFMPKVSLVF